MDYSRKEQCNNSQGGVSKLYIFPYAEYLDNQIKVSNNILTIFPYNIIYDFNAFNINYNNDIKEDKDFLCDINISFQIKKLQETDFFKEFIQRDYRIIIKDNNKKIRLFGLTNGLSGSYKEDVGTNRNEFNGYSFTFQGKEEDTPPYLDDLSLFNIMPIEGLSLEDGIGNSLQDGINNTLTN